MKTHAFVFARGGSKGLPRKNVLPLGGLPLVAHSIRTAQGVPGIAHVWVSTDCAEITEAARTHGASVIARPDELASDNAPEWLAWQHAVRYVENQDGPFERFVSLPATSPLRSTSDVEDCLALLDDRTDGVVTVTPASRSPYFNMMVRDDNGYSKVMLADKAIRRRQDAPMVYDMTTVAYVSRPAFIMNHGGLFEGRIRSHIVPKERAVDIDDAFDFAVAAALLEATQHA